MTYNRLRGLLSEFGVVLPQSPEKVRRHITEHLDTLSGWAKRSISDLLEHAGHIEDRLLEYDRAIAEIAREDARSKRLMRLRGIGPTTASALLASIGAGHDFRNDRQVAAWMGLTPGRYSSGGKARLGSITKAGDAYLRGLPVNGARSRPMRAANVRAMMVISANAAARCPSCSRHAATFAGRTGDASK
ncbi:hypothetical protein LMG24235_08000 [Paraburkholderia sabiae]|nr:hypothetical protein LMG24235_08000 [Paraburkholderia sabiae]